MLFWIFTQLIFLAKLSVRLHTYMLLTQFLSFRNRHNWMNSYSKTFNWSFSVRTLGLHQMHIEEASPSILAKKLLWFIWLCRAHRELSNGNIDKKSHHILLYKMPFQLVQVRKAISGQRWNRISSFIWNKLRQSKETNQID